MNYSQTDIYDSKGIKLKFIISELLMKYTKEGGEGFLLIINSFKN